MFRKSDVRSRRGNRKKKKIEKNAKPSAHYIPLGMYLRVAQQAIFAPGEWLSFKNGFILMYTGIGNRRVVKEKQTQIPFLFHLSPNCLMSTTLPPFFRC
jgi:hypothetical protein